MGTRDDSLEVVGKEATGAPYFSSARGASHVSFIGSAHHLHWFSLAPKPNQSLPDAIASAPHLRSLKLLLVFPAAPALHPPLSLIHSTPLTLPSGDPRTRRYLQQDEDPPADDRSRPCRAPGAPRRDPRAKFGGQPHGTSEQVCRPRHAGELDSARRGRTRNCQVAQDRFAAWGG